MHQALYTVAAWDQWLTIAIYMVALILLLYSASRVSTTVSTICSLIFHNNSTERLEESNAKIKARRLTLFFIFFFISILVSYTYCNRFSIHFRIPRSIVTIVAMLFCSAVISMRIMIFKVLDWVNNTRVFTLLRSIFWSYFTFFILLLAPAFILTYFIDSFDVLFFSIYLFSAIFVVETLHASKIISILKQHGFSISFRILYLCALDFLPIILLVALFESTVGFGA